MASLEELIIFSSDPPIEDDERIQARTRFYGILKHYENGASIMLNGQYSRTKLLQLTYEYAISDKSKDSVLRAFFNAVGLSMNEQDDDVDLSTKETEDRILSKLIGFADFLIDNFFFLASTKRTPQLSPAYHSAVQRARAGGQSFTGTSARLKSLRGDCLVRDRHRCVISRRFDQAQAVKRMQKAANDARDDDNGLLTGEVFETLEVAHILPHSLMKSNPGSELDGSRAAALKILNMFDSDVVHLIDGPEIYFEPVGDAPNTYKMDTFLPYAALNHLLPVTRSLFVTEERTIDPPSPRLLAIHRAIAHIPHLSAAGAYIDKILEDKEEQDVRVDGSTPLGRLVQLRMDGWWDGRVGV
ncbi:hypothetical protein PT974_10533 [Cladobotryum mycophilum]|uniref:HNH nuclease domain-containing protein n=1 Tax=Cladobotryum mycophilum TaxID=491253 RepID=A0ABR0SA40_9HYPO